MTAISPVQLLEEQVLPALFEDPGRAFPEFGWKRHRDGWKATNDSYTDTMFGCRAERVGFYRSKGRIPSGFLVIGGDSTPWTAWVLSECKTPSGSRFTDAVRRLAELVGVDPGQIGRELSPAEAGAIHDRRAAAADQTKRAEADDQKRRDSNARAAAEVFAYAASCAESGGDELVRGYLRARGAITDDFDLTPKRLMMVRAIPAGSSVMVLYMQQPKPGKPAEVKPYTVEGPIIVAGARLADDPEAGVRGVQRIELQRRDPTKKLAGKAKKMLGDLTGTAVPIPRAEGGPREIYLCEGVETGVAIASATGAAVFCCLSTSGLVGWRPPAWLLGDQAESKVDRIRIAGDFDEFKGPPNDQHRPGERFGRRAAERLASMTTVRVELAIPDDELMGAIHHESIETTEAVA